MTSKIYTICDGKRQDLDCAIKYLESEIKYILNILKIYYDIPENTIDVKKETNRSNEMPKELICAICGKSIHKCTHGCVYLNNNKQE